MSSRENNNAKSLLLSDIENECIFNVLGKGSTTLATSVVQLFLSEGVNKQEWKKRCCGVLCFIKDNSRRSYFFRLYDLLNQQKTWEQEVYIHFKYKTPRKFFHTFEAHDCQAGLNFASEREAETFKQVVQGKLLDRQIKRLEKKRQPEGGKRPAFDKGLVPPLPARDAVPNKPVTNTTPDLPKTRDKVKGKGGKKITKSDISSPTQFRHVGHAGWDPESGLQTEKLDPEMKALFEEIGLNDHSQVDEDTIDFIYDFVDKYGGLSAVREDLARKRPPAVPASTDHLHTHTGKSPARELPPLLPSRHKKPTAVPPPIISQQGHQRTDTGRNVPPPPLLDIPPPPPLPPPSTSTPLHPPLKTSTEISKPPPTSGRGGLLDDIANFKSSKLSHVQPEQNGENPAKSSIEASGGIAAALMDALNKRKPAMQLSDDDDTSSDEIDDDEEWDD